MRIAFALGAYFVSYVLLVQTFGNSANGWALLVSIMPAVLAFSVTPSKHRSVKRHL